MREFPQGAHTAAMYTTSDHDAERPELVGKEHGPAS